MPKHITLHPQYFLKEGFGTLMSHYAVMYSLYRDSNITPVILDIDFKSQKLTSAMEGFNKKSICSTKFIDKDKDPETAELLNYKWYPEDWIALDMT